MNIFTKDSRRPAFLLSIAALWVWGMTAGLSAAQTEPSPTAESAAEDVVTATAEPTATATFAPPGDIRFGVIESFEDPQAAGRLGVAWTRARFQWADVQPDGPDDWRPPLDDEALAVEMDAGREVVGLLIGIPDWARDRRNLPRGLALPYDDPDNTWGVFVAEVVARYAGRIDRWIIWNEPDIDDLDAPGHTWDGDIEEFFQLQRTAYLAAKAANPDAVIHLGAFTYFWDPGYFSRFLNVVAADPEAAAHNYYFDVATAHLYFQPNAVFNVLYAFRRVLDAHGLAQPIWLVETNAPPMDDPYWTVDNWTLAVSLNEQAAFVPQAVAVALAAGAERVSVYKLKDTAGDRAANPEPFGLVRWDNSRRPAFDTYRTAIRLLGGVRRAERERWDAVGQIRLEQAGQSTTVLFARLPGRQETTVAATAATAEWVDMWGRRETIEAERGVFAVDLPGALCRQTIADYCMIGGTTYYLIQANGGQEQDERDVAIDEGTGSAVVSSTASRTPRPQPTGAGRPTTMPPATATLEPSPTPPSTTPTPTTGPLATPTTVAAQNPAAVDRPLGRGSNSSGLIVLGLGLALGAGMVVWLARRHGTF
ncbi:MAG: hypothetical protein KA586_00645 [Candidatus Promineofilum sp.]|nr:hypothetical protein [Promineifilum sp.]